MAARRPAALAKQTKAPPLCYFEPHRSVVRAGHPMNELTLCGPSIAKSWAELFQRHLFGNALGYPSALWSAFLHRCNLQCLHLAF